MPNKWFCFRGKRKGYILRRDIVHRSICWFAFGAICSIFFSLPANIFLLEQKNLLVHFTSWSNSISKMYQERHEFASTPDIGARCASLSENFRHKTQCQRDVNHGSRKFFFLLSFRHKTKPRRSRQCSKYIWRKHGCSFFAFRFVGFIIHAVDLSLLTYFLFNFIARSYCRQQRRGKKSIFDWIFSADSTVVAKKMLKSLWSEGPRPRLRNASHSLAVHMSLMERMTRAASSPAYM